MTDTYTFKLFQKSNFKMYILNALRFANSLDVDKVIVMKL